MRLFKIRKRFFLHGNTFHVKEELKKIGFRWDPYFRMWFSEDSNIIKRIKMDSYLRDLVNLNGLENELERERDSFKKIGDGVKERYPFLYDFQVDAIRFGIDKDALFGHDMGLGKTIITIVLLQVLKFDKILVVAPKSVLFQWREEILKWTKEKALVIEGNQEKRLSEYFKEKWTIVNYEKLRDDVYSIRFEKRFALVCDEVSKLKNYRTQNYKAIKAIRRRAKRIYMLTGTAIENALSDFFNISRVIKPNFMSVSHFRKNYCEFEKLWTKRGVVEIIKGYKNLDDFIMRISEFTIRRKREEVLNFLPEIQEVTRSIDLTQEQYLVYDKILERVRKGGKDKFDVLQLLRLVADDLRLFNISKSSFVSEMGLKDFSNGGNKIEETQQILKESGKSKVIIFTQFAKMAKILQKEIPDSEIIYGALFQRERERRIDNFRRNKRILISTDTLAYGMNLQFADILVNFDLPWNPAVLKQRIARIYRIGSKSSKLVINLWSKEIEDRVLEIIKIKKDLFDKVVNGKAITDENLRKILISKFLENDGEG